ncbi:MAG: fibronectin type III domain-containing protein [Gammaproteobacteria bacterium]|nr:MAG: fibronectin type III domain-containing protein [Gammaproteobacteria bacterium]
MTIFTSGRWKQRSQACLLSAIILSLTGLFSGCQEDDRASHTSTSQASELAQNRLDDATGGLMDALGQTDGDPDQAQAQETDQPKTLSWTPPLTREDGSALTHSQIAGFRIYFRLRHQQSFDTILIDDPSTTSYVLDNLPAGAYEFAITTVDLNGLESQRSDPVLADLI